MARLRPNVRGKDCHFHKTAPCQIETSTSKKEFSCSVAAVLLFKVIANKFSAVVSVASK